MRARVQGAVNATADGSDGGWSSEASVEEDDSAFAWDGRTSRAAAASVERAGRRHTCLLLAPHLCVRLASAPSG